MGSGARDNISTGPYSTITVELTLENVFILDLCVTWVRPVSTVRRPSSRHNRSVTLRHLGEVILEHTASDNTLG